MLELADRLLASLDAGRPLVVATAIAVDGSAPRTAGTSMAWDGDAVLGSIAGGCVEGAVVEVAERVLGDRRVRVVEFGISDEQALGVGLACGGRLSIHLAVLEPSDAVATAALRAAAAGEAAALALHPGGFAAADCAPADAFVDRSQPPARLIVVGAMEHSSALAAAAQALGFAVTVCDPRELFTTPARFPGADLAVEWPPDYLAATDVDERTVICLLSHDDRFDADALEVALASPAGYVGAMGSRRTTERRLTQLRRRGVDASRLHAPIGLDLGASTPAETAVSILAEVLAARAGREAAPLREREGSIHRPAAVPATT